jgi:hypothetical protein
MEAADGVGPDMVTAMLRRTRTRFRRMATVGIVRDGAHGMVRARTIRTVAMGWRAGVVGTAIMAATMVIGIARSAIALTPIESMLT